MNEDIQNGLTAIVVGILITVFGSFYVYFSIVGG